jgi:hypothetical protein
MRRLVYLHSAGPYVGLRQIVGVVDDSFIYYDTGARAEMRSLEPGSPLPDKLAAIEMLPDRRLAKAMRLKSTDTYALYKESVA